MLFLLDLGRSRVIMVTREIYDASIFWIYGILDYAGKKENLETGRGRG